MSGWLQCDACGARLASDGAATQADVVAAARAAGWTGSMTAISLDDRCPACQPTLPAPGPRLLDWSE